MILRLTDEWWALFVKPLRETWQMRNTLTTDRWCNRSNIFGSSRAESNFMLSFIDYGVVYASGHGGLFVMTTNRNSVSWASSTAETRFVTHRFGSGSAVDLHNIFQRMRKKHSRNMMIRYTYLRKNYNKHQWFKFFEKTKRPNELRAADKNALLIVFKVDRP